MINPQLYSDRFEGTATHGTLAVVTKAAVAGRTHYITDISVSSDKAGSIVLVKDGTTVIWQVQVGATFYNKDFSVPLQGTAGNLVSVEIDGSSACKANMTGFTV